MIERKQYRACLKAGWKQEQLEEEVKAAAKTAHDAVESGDILTASLYRHKDMCFLYYEALKKNIGPTDFLDPLTPFLKSGRKKTERHHGRTCITFSITTYRKT